MYDFAFCLLPFELFCMLNPLSKFLQDAVKRTGQKQSIDASVIVDSARPIILQILPELRPADFEIVSYRDGILTIATASPIISQELRLHAEPIIDALRDAFANPMTKLRYVPLVEKEEEWN